MSNEQQEASTAALTRLADDVAFAWDATAKLAMVPLQNRPAALARIAPVLQQHFPQEDFSQVDLSDEGLRRRLSGYDQLLEQLGALAPSVQRAAEPRKKGGRKALFARLSPYREPSGARTFGR